MNKSEKTMIPVVANFFDHYLEDISIGVYFNDGIVIPVIEEKDLFVDGMLFIPNKDYPASAIPSEIICSVKSTGHFVSRGDNQWTIYECEYYSRPEKKLIKQQFATVKKLSPTIG